MLISSKLCSLVKHYLQLNHVDFCIFAFCQSRQKFQSNAIQSTLCINVLLHYICTHTVDIKAGSKILLLLCVVYVHRRSATIPWQMSYWMNEWPKSINISDIAMPYDGFVLTLQSVIQ